MTVCCAEEEEDERAAAAASLSRTARFNFSLPSAQPQDRLCVNLLKSSLVKQNNGKFSVSVLKNTQHIIFLETISAVTGSSGEYLLLKLSSHCLELKFLPMTRQHLFRFSQ